MITSTFMLAYALFYSAPFSLATDSRYGVCLSLTRIPPNEEFNRNFTDSYPKRLSDDLDSARGYDVMKSQQELAATTTGPSLRGHIVNAHFQAGTLRDLGVAVFDIELARFRNFEIAWVVRKIYEKLERQDPEIVSEIKEHGKNQIKNPLYDIKDFGIVEYRTMLIKNLLFIESLYGIEIDWNRIEIVFPNARKVRLDIKVDTTDASFKKLYSALTWKGFSR
jgi:hypothetical protein